MGPVADTSEVVLWMTSRGIVYQQIGYGVVNLNQLGLSCLQINNNPWSRPNLGIVSPMNWDTMVFYGEVCTSYLFASALGIFLNLSLRQLDPSGSNSRNPSPIGWNFFFFFLLTSHKDERRRKHTSMFLAFGRMILSDHDETSISEQEYLK